VVVDVGSLPVVSARVLVAWQTRAGRDSLIVIPVARSVCLVLLVVHWWAADSCGILFV
jgi:hypothetical protein